jgi:hypothetical protein
VIRCCKQLAASGFKSVAEFAHVAEFGEKLGTEVAVQKHPPSITG